MRPKQGTKECYEQALRDSGKELNPQMVLAMLQKSDAPSFPGAQRFTVKRAQREWWFACLREDFTKFSENQIIRGYEIVRRHPGFDAWRKSHPRQRRLPPWPKSNESTKHDFQNTFGGDLSRLGLIVPFTKLELTVRRVRWKFLRRHRRAIVRICPSKFVLSRIGRVRVTFDCTLGRRAILREFSRQLNRFKEFTKFRAYEESVDRTRVAKNPLKFKRSVFHPFVVSVDLTPLLVQLSERDANILNFYRESLTSSIETFLAKNCSYRNYREKCQRVKKAIHTKQVSPEVCALGCIAWDWRRAGRGLQKLSIWLQHHGISLRSAGLPLLGSNPTLSQWEEALQAVKRCFTKVHLPGNPVDNRVQETKRLRPVFQPFFATFRLHRPGK